MIQIARVVDRVAEPSDALRRALDHRSLGHRVRRPKLELIAVRVLPEKGNASRAFVRDPNGVGVDGAYFIEPAPMLVDIGGVDVEAVARVPVAQTARRRQRLPRKKAAVAATREGLESAAPLANFNRLGKQNRAKHLLVKSLPTRAVVGTHDIVVDPVNRAGSLVRAHLISSFRRKTLLQLGNCVKFSFDASLRWSGVDLRLPTGQDLARQRHR